jgi:hypothetical protein
MAFYVGWMINAFGANRGIVEEWKCWFAVWFGFICVALPILVAVWGDVFANPTSLLAASVIAFMAINPLLCIADNMRTFLLFCAYSPFMLVYATFFTIFIPHYSFARIHDTSWGNRAQSASAEGALEQKKDDIMKKVIRGLQ